MEQIITEILQHIAIVNTELGQLQVDVAVLKTQVGQIMWMQRAVLGIVIAFVVGKILYSTFRNRINKIAE